MTLHAPFVTFLGFFGPPPAAIFFKSQIKPFLTVINFNISPRTLNRLSNENKADLVMAEIDEIEHEISWQKECTQKTVFNGKALMEFLDQKYSAFRNCGRLRN